VQIQSAADTIRQGRPRFSVTKSDTYGERGRKGEIKSQPDEKSNLGKVWGGERQSGEKKKEKVDEPIETARTG